MIVGTETTEVYPWDDGKDEGDETGCKEKHGNRADGKSLGCQVIGGQGLYGKPGAVP